MLSIIITSYNEGRYLNATLRSIRQNTSDYEVILVDDGSDDGSCEPGALDGPVAKVIRMVERTGIASSRNVGAHHAKGDCLAFLDGHHLLSEGCLNLCAVEALQRRAIVYPCIRGLEDHNWTGHGAVMRQQDGKKCGLFGAAWKNRAARDKLSRCSTFVVPGYVMSRETFEVVRWIDGLLGWGASEPAITVKAFFADVSLLHLCGPLCRHYFRPGTKIPYDAPWTQVATNHALVARVCFEEATWRDYWIPQVFRRWLSPEDLESLEAESVKRQHEAFRLVKQRPDREFWRGLILTDFPEGVA